MITQARLKELFYYHPESGDFVRLVRTAQRTKVGEQAGMIDAKGYSRLRVGGKMYQGSRLAWLYMTGQWPKEMIDHKDMNPSNDSFSNLREATRSENGHNVVARSNSATGVKGVCWHKAAKAFVVQVQTNGENRHFGCYPTLEEATAARDKAIRENHGNFARL